MQWDDKAIILSARRMGESAGLIHVLSEQHGMHKGVDRGAFGKRKRGLYQPGNIVSVHWQARMSEQLGSFTCELMDPVSAYLLDDRRKLAALTSATLMLEKILAEREPHADIYQHFEALLQALRGEGDWLAGYVRFEFMLLAAAGFGLDLARCAATGQTHDLHYVSPRSGRAVSRLAGAPYHERLLMLPAFLVSRGENSPIQLAQILDGARLCGYFLQERVFAPRGGMLPAVRARFLEMLHVKDISLGEVAPQYVG